MDQKRDLRSEVLGFVKRFVNNNGYGPTCDEIRVAVGLSSKSHAAYYLGVLDREGLIKRTPRSPRGVRLADASPIEVGMTLSRPAMAGRASELRVPSPSSGSNRNATRTISETGSPSDRSSTTGGSTNV